MDAGSLETVAGYDVPEDVLSYITRSVVEGLQFLKVSFIPVSGTCVDADVP